MRVGVVLWGGNLHTRLPALLADLDRTLSAGEAYVTVLVSAEQEPLYLVDRLVGDTDLDPDRVWFDYRPWDTVSQAWYLRDWVHDLGLDEVRLVTDAFHGLRSALVTRILLLGMGCRVRVVPASGPGRDPVVRLVKDLLRAVLARTCGVLVGRGNKQQRWEAGGLGRAAWQAHGLQHVRRSGL